MKGYFIEEEQLEKLRQLQNHLHGGSDPMRDAGHKLWLLLNTIQDQDITLDEEN